MVTADEKIPLYQQMIYARNTLKDQLSTLSGVGDVAFGGYVDPICVCGSMPSACTITISPLQMCNAIQAEQIEQPAGGSRQPEKR